MKKIENPKKTKSVIKNLPTKESNGSDDFTVEYLNKPKDYTKLKDSHLLISKLSTKLQ